MKKLFTLSAMALSLSVAAIAGTDAIQELNARVVEIFAPFNNPVTSANLTFSAIETNAERALNVALSGAFRKIGSKNTLELKVDSLSYAYGNGSAPTTNFKGSFATDFTKFVPQKDINDMIPGIERFVEDTAKGMTKEYGDAATVSAKITDKRQDAEGNFTGIDGVVDFSLDLAKLPEGVKLSSVPVTSGQVSFSIEITKGISFGLNVVSNPEYSAFKSDQLGLKEYLDKLLAKDEAILNKIAQGLSSIDRFAAGLVENQR